MRFDFLFRGEEQIDVKILESTSSITMHSLNLDIKSFTISVADTTFKPTSVTNPSKDTVKFSFDAQLHKSDNAQISITFSGTVSKKMKGYFTIFPLNNTLVFTNAKRFKK
jgi:aminopeptidase 2